MPSGCTQLHARHQKTTAGERRALQLGAAATAAKKERAGNNARELHGRGHALRVRRVRGVDDGDGLRGRLADADERAGVHRDRLEVEVLRLDPRRAELGAADAQGKRLMKAWGRRDGRACGVRGTGQRGSYKRDSLSRDARRGACELDDGLYVFLNRESATV